MGSTAIQAETPPKALLAEVRRLLKAGEVYAAQQLAAASAAEHPEDEELRKIHELLNVGKAQLSPGSGSSFRQEIAWLRDPPEELRGMWIAVVGKEVLASAKTLRELMTQLASNQGPMPLVLQIEA